MDIMGFEFVLVLDDQLEILMLPGVLDDLLAPHSRNFLAIEGDLAD